VLTQEYSVKISQILNKIILKNKKFSVTDTIFVTGSPRSGTSWLMEILRNIPDYTYSFEPLNPIWYHEPRKLGFHSRVYLPPDANWPEGEEYFKKIINGEKVGFQYLYRFTPKEVMSILLGKKLIVKSVRANRLLPWMAKRFQIHKLIFIVRHPCAVIASQLKTGFCGYHDPIFPYGNIFPTNKQILAEASQIDELDDSLLKKLKNIKTREETLAAAWCLDNCIPLLLPKPRPWTFIIYEKLVQDGKKDLTRIFNELGEKNIPQSAYQQLRILSLVSPSRLGLEDEQKAVPNTNIQLSKWKTKLSETQIERILKVVSDFGIDFYTRDLEPEYRNIDIS